MPERDPGFYWLRKLDDCQFDITPQGGIVHVDERGWISLFQPNCLISEKGLVNLGMSICKKVGNGNMFTEAETLYRDALRKWGRDKQLGVPIEECAELIHKLIHYRDRDRCSAADVLKEAVDVINATGMLLYILAEDVNMEYEDFIQTVAGWLSRERDRTRRKVNGVE